MFYIVNFTKCVSQHRFFKYSIRSYDKYYKQLKIHTWILPKELMFTSHYICFVVFMGGGWRKVNTLPSQACMANRDESWTITHFILYLLPKENDTTT